MSVELGNPNPGNTSDNHSASIYVTLIHLPLYSCPYSFRDSAATAFAAVNLQSFYFQRMG